MIATEAFLVDELIEVAIGAAISQLPNVLMYLLENYDDIKDKIDELAVKIGRLI